MSKGTLLRSLSTLMLLIIVNNYLASQRSDTFSIRIMFYNVENFFDIYDDTLRDDNDFLPNGLMRWNYTRYKQKITSIYKVITAAGGWDPPAIIGFCEIEKRSILEDLIFNTYLTKYNYQIIHEESPDWRGIDVCLIYRKDRVNLLGYQYIFPEDLKRQESGTRNVLYSSWLISKDTIHLFLNHWPSKRGGVLPGEPVRISISQMIRNKVDSINMKTNGHARIVIAGDFNCLPGDKGILSLLKSDKEYPELINLAEQYSETGYGTYRFMGIWEMLDQVIVSGWLLKCDQGISTSLDLFKIFKPDFLLRKDSEYPGVSPFSTYRGYRYQGGYSDHLPVTLDLRIKRVNPAR